jgi:hypothetical protein
MVRIAYVFILPNAGGKNYPVLAVVLKKIVLVKINQFT